MAKKLDLNKTVYEIHTGIPGADRDHGRARVYRDHQKAHAVLRRQDHDDSQRREDQEYLYDGCRNHLDGQRL